jgi:hypothetical protein
VLLDVQLDAVVHLSGRVRKLAREAHDQTDLQRLLRMRDTNAVAQQQKAETQNCLSHCFLPSSAPRRYTARQLYHKPQLAALINNGHGRLPTMHRILSSHLQTEIAKFYKLTPTELRVLFAIHS